MKPLVLFPLVTLLLCSCSVTDVSRGVNSGPYEVYKDGHTPLTLETGSPVVTEIQKWILDKSSEWENTITTYVPQIEVRNKHFSLNILPDAAVLNFEQPPKSGTWRQVIKKYGPVKPGFVEVLNKMLEKTKEG